MRFGVKSDKGRIRTINEDYLNVVSDSNFMFNAFIIADGMGGHNAGEIASKSAVESVTASIREYCERFTNPDEISKLIEKIMLKANSEVLEKSNECEANHGMGTTLIVSALYQDNIYIGHVGDSRAYLLRDEALERITTDHSFIEELIKNGSIKREEAENHPKKNLITRAIGCYEEVLIDSYICNVKKDDIFILCTDGLTNMLDENQIAEILKNFKEPQEACDELVRLANENGGEDNISLIVVKI